ncbi:hypothetical protein TRVA0_001S05116 [Trichomonascus vanleenenianus]|uniref:uncharacterized protein n=1 Tax=Trichomonascus vanleenenianus TaxID=2268995 RepID=UPI003EC99155
MSAPQTPPSESTGSSGLVTPPTPRYAPMDEPDRFINKRRKVDNDKKEGLALPAAKSLILTPAETPVNRKKAIELVEGSLGTTGRVLFPTHQKIGSGRQGQRSINSSISCGTSIISSGSSRTSVGPSTFSSSAESSRKPKKSLPVINVSPFEVKKSPKFSIFSDHRALQKEVDNSDPFARSDDPFGSERIDKTAQHHPHLPVPNNRPGMWYVFRGKQLFRPAKKGEDIDIKPKRLFQKEISERKKRKRTSEEKEKPKKELENIFDSDEEADTDREEMTSPPPPSPQKRDSNYPRTRTVRSSRTDNPRYLFR